jgi:hypothetical protein
LQDATTAALHLQQPKALDEEAADEHPAQRSAHNDTLLAAEQHGIESFLEGKEEEQQSSKPAVEKDKEQQQAKEPRPKEQEEQQEAGGGAAVQDQQGASGTHAKAGKQPQQRCAVYNNVGYHMDVAAGMAWAFQVWLPAARLACSECCLCCCMLLLLLLHAAALVCNFPLRLVLVPAAGYCCLLVLGLGAIGGGARHISPFSQISPSSRTCCCNRPALAFLGRRRPGVLLLCTWTA